MEIGKQRKRMYVLHLDDYTNINYKISIIIRISKINQFNKYKIIITIITS